MIAFDKAVIRTLGVELGVIGLILHYCGGIGQFIVLVVVSYSVNEVERRVNGLYKLRY